MENIFRFLRAWLRGDFQPGLKFRPAHRAEILLQLHAQFQPGRKTQWQSSLRCEYTVDAHASVPFSTRDEKNDSDYTDFSARLAGLKILARYSQGPITWWILARAEISLRTPGWNIVVITCSISARAQNANLREKVYWGAKTQLMLMLACLFQPGLKLRFDHMRLFQIFRPVWPGWKS